MKSVGRLTFFFDFLPLPILEIKEIIKAREIERPYDL